MGAQGEVRGGTWHEMRMPPALARTLYGVRSLQGVIDKCSRIYFAMQARDDDVGDNIRTAGRGYMHIMGKRK